ncbi:MAG: hypothetical protein OFPII_04680 [Osedax symbiont Rs1]|nr:MAG: hypothetical protein OFPII_04680 [Osedax symbiont Rs1]
MNSIQLAELFALKGVYPDLSQLLALRKYTEQLSLETVARTSPSAGNWQTRMRGRGLDFAEVRRYQAGDDVRSIDWRVTAKTQKTHTRLFTQERERPIILVADLRSDMFFGSVNCFKSVTCAGLMSALAWVALKSKDRVGGLVIGDNQHIELRPKAHKKIVLSFIHYLDEYCRQLTSPIADSSKQSMDQLLIKLKRVTRPGSAIYIASDFHDLETVNIGRLVKLSQHNQLVFMVISDPLEWHLPVSSSLLVSDGNTTCELQNNSANNRLMQRRLDKIEAICKPLNIEVMQVSTSDKLLTVLQQRFSNKRQHAARIKRD